MIEGLVASWRLVGRGVVIGALCGALMGIAGLLLLKDVEALADPRGWLVLAAAINAVWGGVAGGLGVMVLTARARDLDNVRRLIVDGTLLGAAVGFGLFSVGSLQAGSPGPLSILFLALFGGAASGFLVATSMKPAKLVNQSRAGAKL